MTISPQDGTFNPTLDNKLGITAQCDVTGSGGQATTACWRAQLAECGTVPCDTGRLPPYNATGPTTYAPASVAYGGSPPTYVSTYQFTTLISSNSTSNVTGVIYPGASNKVEVKATCIIEGQYALTAVQNWPAQMQLCGPNGGQPCSGNSYDPGAPTLTPSKVTYNSTNNRYTAEYTFTIDDAWKGQPITHRYFLCLYEDASANVVQNEGSFIQDPAFASISPPPTIQIHSVRPAPPCPCHACREAAHVLLAVCRPGLRAPVAAAPRWWATSPAPVGPDGDIGIVGLGTTGDTAAPDSDSITCSSGVALGMDTARFNATSPLPDVAKLIKPAATQPASAQPATAQPAASLATAAKPTASLAAAT
ncbi:hypothetical protein CHLNCDRAFT_145495 [Chlorella variabilis]|uniref:Uncharacterized protein n=1 Tax=Chlorella variabilis TaxID=554065 RepID=E1ZDL8_CHLVA|nr:hypothetical protein CHLNCDRAFT_145495 [Chlorella variabilis]EFN56046.1 hypothetical protein CHLNCDRAFT_145495 [Chlorella variabilis]|eukprot:XP_005848148.1 hypothetical protein CHLNCDRAFT_145495 [Chlorella variabilis]